MLTATGQPYVEALETQRYDAGALGQFLFKGRYVVTARAAVVRQSHDHQFGEVVEAIGTTRSSAKWRCVGPRVARHGSRGSPSNGTRTRRAMCLDSICSYFTVPGAFAQYDITASANLSLSASARVDVHSEYGTFFSPRVSALAHAGSAGRAGSSVGNRLFGPTPRSPKRPRPPASRGSKSASLSRPSVASARPSTYRRTDGTGLPYTATLFRIPHRQSVCTWSDRQLLASSAHHDPRPQTSQLRPPGNVARKEPFSGDRDLHLCASSSRPSILPLSSRRAHLARHSAGIVGMWRAEDVGRVGIEWSCTPGASSLEENPYRTGQRAVHDSGSAGGKAQFGRIRLFVNGEFHGHPGRRDGIRCFLPTRAVDGRWTVDERRDG